MSSSFRIAVGPVEPDPVIEVICRDGQHSVRIAELRRDERWGGSGGHYWVRLARMTGREREAYQAAPRLGEAMPRESRSPTDGGFRWLRHGEPVDTAEAYTIGQAYHHNALSGRTGTPEPGTLDGVTRVFSLRGCPRCAQRAVPVTLAEHVEFVLNRLHENGIHVVDLRTFRDAIATRSLLAP